MGSVSFNHFLSCEIFVFYLNFIHLEFFFKKQGLTIELKLASNSQSPASVSLLWDYYTQLVL